MKRMTPCRLMGFGVLVFAAMMITASSRVMAQASQEGPAAAAAAWTHPRTAWGDPDLRGIWDPVGPPPVERPARFKDKPVLTDAELAAELKDAQESPAERARGAFVRGIANENVGRTRFVQTRRTGAIIDPPDGRLPPWTPETIRRHEARVAARSDRGESGAVADLGFAERCLRLVDIAANTPLAFIEAEGDPRNILVNNGSSTRPIMRTMRILQLPGYVVIVREEGVADYRIIPLGRPPLDPVIREYRGESRGRWEGTTLVLETTNINDKQDGGTLVPAHLGVVGLTSPEPWFYPGTGENLRVIERFTRVAPDRVEYRVTIEDATVYTRPYTILVDLNRAEKFFVHQYQCHENNTSMRHVLAAARVDPQYAADSAAEVRETWRDAWEKLKADWAARTYEEQSVGGSTDPS